MFNRNLQILELYMASIIAPAVPILLFCLFLAVIGSFPVIVMTDEENSEPVKWWDSTTFKYIFQPMRGTYAIDTHGMRVGFMYKLAVLSRLFLVSTIFCLICVHLFSTSHLAFFYEDELFMLRVFLDVHVVTFSILALISFREIYVARGIADDMGRLVQHLYLFLRKRSSKGEYATAKTIERIVNSLTVNQWRDIMVDTDIDLDSPSDASIIRVFKEVLQIVAADETSDMETLAELSSIVQTATSKLC